MDAVVAVTCGDGIVDSETFEVCDPGLPVGSQPLLRCECPSDNNSCTNDVWVDDPVDGKCFGTCQHPALTGYPYVTCDDGNACTTDTIVSGTAANCDLVCSHSPRSGFGITTCVDGDACTNDIIVSGSPATCDVVCGNTPRTGFGINTCDDGIACTVDTILTGSPATCNVTCSNSPLSTTDSTCDGVDDNCNGIKDEQYVPHGTTCGMGACASFGATSCVAGAEVNSCMPGNGSLVDNTCNNVDDDCNGVKDDGYVTLATTCGRGACASSGFTTCAGGAVINSCVPGTPAGGDSTCNNIDDDCNGATDDGYIPVPTSCGVGACAATGVSTCTGGVVGSTCTAGTPAATDSTCNNVDDNCNGVRDDGFVPVATSCGIGACAASGFTTCSGGVTGNTCTPGTPAGSDTTCNNIDDDCNGTKDEGYNVTSTSCGVGACARTGSNTCVGGTVVNSCTPGVAAPNDTSCNNVDDDCNGARDDGYAPTTTNCGVGACAATGSTSCFGGVVLNSCTPGAPAGSDTTCNNIDDDCNTFTDEGYNPQPTTCGVGACAATGATTCTGGVVGNSCTPSTPAATDTTCNNVDDNCNGMTDEGWTVTPTMCGAGVCANTGGMVCSAGVVSNSCVAGTPGGGDATCNNQDDDCDGTKDEEYAPVATSCGVGACAATGVSTCSGGTVGSTCMAGTPSATDTTCNASDDNCNGLTDEGYVSMPTSCGIGACARSGSTSCSGGVVGNSCVPGIPAGSDTTCNGVDDDCNGLVDDGYVSLTTSCGVGACRRNGATSCVMGTVVDSCAAGTPAATDTTCNGVDDNCNGVNDEGYAPTGTSCGVGACAATGFTSCAGGVVQNSCTPGAPAGSDASCNNIDDDCNGFKDDGYVPLTTNCGVGACARTGATSCVAGAVQNSCTAGTPGASDTSCNNVDDDCNGARDDGYVVTATACGVGACARTGFNTCQMGTVVNSCMAGTPAGSDTTCNNIDDDCNGTRDDGYMPVTTSCGVGACAASGVTACVTGTVTNSCAPGAPAATDATCNGVDDDCSGQTDEDYASVATSCGIGACAATGATSCVSGAVQNSCMAGTPAAADTTCNNIDDNCNGTKDEGYTPVPTTCGVGSCAATGMTSCVGGVTGNSCVAGTPAATDTTCNATDENCNGVNDEGYMAMATSCGVGACARSGVTSCTGGVVGNSCMAGTPGPSDASCDGVDNNCNGMTDEGYVSTPTSCGVGACMNTGTLACIGGVATNTCVPGMMGGSDTTCNNQDDDCDGTKDEEYVPVGTSCGTGACAATGTSSCVGGMVQTNCNPGTPAASDTSCNNVDDNCNGSTDEGYVVTGTSCGVGACAATGSNICVSGMVQNTCTAGMPAASDTTCNNVDDNCNGTKDEGYVPTPTSCGVGACAATGSNVCSAGGVITNTCTAGTPAATDTNCDGVDNNCNGNVDEGYVVTSTSCGTGACARSGSLTCSGGVQTNSCVAGTPGPSDTTCNNVDENCNGMTDEGYSSTTTSCGVGACAAAGSTSCSSGTVVDSCTPGTPASGDTTCNNVDDNCNGTKDEGYVGTPTACGTGTCARTGSTTCNVGGVLGDSCVAGSPGTESCDNLDNDCNGVTDNGDPGGGGSCTLTANLGVCRPGTNHCISGTIQCTQNVGASAEVCDALDNNCDGTTNDSNPGGGVACTVGGQFGPCANSVTSCLTTDTSIQCRQTVNPSPDLCAAGGGVGNGDGIDQDCDGTVDNNPSVSDGAQLSCGAAASSTYMVSPNGTVNISGNVTVVGGADYFVVNFVGSTSPGVSYHPKFAFTNGGGTYTMTAFTTTACTTAYNGCNGGYSTLESSYAADQNACSSSSIPGHPATCNDTTNPRITTYVLRVQRAVPSTVNCSYYTVTATNI